MKNKSQKMLLFCMIFILLCGSFSLRAQAAPPPGVTYETFDYRRYADDYDDLKQTFGYNQKQLWNHYLDSGFAEGRTVYLTNGSRGTISGAQTGLNKSNFDYRRYADEYADLKRAFGYNRSALWRHFVDFGASEGRAAYVGTVANNQIHAEKAKSFVEASPLPAYWNSREYSAEELQLIKNYYGTTLFVGDSVMSGFGMVCSGSSDSLLKSFHFQAAPSYALVHALRETNGGMHPPFRGQRIPPWNVASTLRANTVFLFLGINDISYTPVDDLITKYKTLIGRIQGAVPGVRIIVMSATYPYPGIKKGGLNGDNIAYYNSRLQQMAAENGWGFVDIAATSKGDGNFMKPELSSDKYVHVHFKVYNDWAKAIKAYAWQQISGE